MQQPSPAVAFGETVALECSAIAGDAMCNARKHAQAEVVSIDVRHGLLGCDIVVSDDGCGIAPGYLAGRERTVSGPAK